jgi:hypothetical protein
MQVRQCVHVPPPAPGQQRREPIRFALTSGAMLLLLCAAGGAVAHPCSTISAGPERLACYDAAFPPAATPANTPPPEGVRDGEREFGLSEHALQVRDAARGQARPDRIEAVIARIDVRANGERVFTLDNGQVWEQTQAMTRGRLHPGDTVTVRNAALGSFMLITPSKVALRVRRVR